MVRPGWICKDPGVPDEETSDDPEPEPGGTSPPAEGALAEASAESSESAPDVAEEPPASAGGEAPNETAPSETAPSEAPLSGETLIVEVLRRDPNAARVLAEEFDLPCYRCPARHVETLAGGITYMGHEAEQILSRLAELRGEPLCAPEAGA